MSYTVSVKSLVLVIVNLYQKLPYESLLKTGFKTNDSKSLRKTATSKLFTTNLANGKNIERQMLTIKIAMAECHNSASILGRTL